MPREKKYTKTIAFRVTEYEWQLIQYAMKVNEYAKPSAWIRNALKVEFVNLQNLRQQEAKRAEAASKRIAKKAEASAQRLKESRGL